MAMLELRQLQLGVHDAMSIVRTILGIKVIDQTEIRPQAPNAPGSFFSSPGTIVG